MNSIFHRVSIRKFQDKPVEPEKNREPPSCRHGSTLGEKPAAMGILCRDQ